VLSDVPGLPSSGFNYLCENNVTRTIPMILIVRIKMKKVGSFKERKDVEGPSPDMFYKKGKAGRNFFESPDFF
jgi:hypothetical protein